MERAETSTAQCTGIRVCRTDRPRAGFAGGDVDRQNLPLTTPRRFMTAAQLPSPPRIATLNSRPRVVPRPASVPPRYPPLATRNSSRSEGHATSASSARRRKSR